MEIDFILERQFRHIRVVNLDFEVGGRLKIRDRAIFISSSVIPISI
jgi:hypothetical protein